MKFYKVVARPTLLYGSETRVTTKRDMTRLDAAEIRFLRIVKIRQNKKRKHEKKTRDPWITRCKNQIQTKLEQPLWKNGKQQTRGTPPQIQTPRTNRSWSPQETMAKRRCPTQVKRSNPWRKMMKMISEKYYGAFNYHYWQFRNHPERVFDNLRMPVETYHRLQKQTTNYRQPISYTLWLLLHQGQILREYSVPWNAQIGSGIHRAEYSMDTVESITFFVDECFMRKEYPYYCV